MTDALARVTRLLEGAREVARDATLIEPLVASTGLSPEGVRLGLSRYLEIDAGEAELTELVRKAMPASRVHVILSANVFTAPLRALAVALAQTPHVSVRPSRRDPVLTQALVRATPSLGITLAHELDVSSLVEGEVHVYGRDETVQEVSRRAREGVEVRAHGAGFGVAFVTRNADLVEAAHGVADDVVVFDQRGCLSPRIVVVEGDEARGEQLVSALSASLEELGRSVPRGRLDADEERGARRYVETMAFAGKVLERESHAVGLGANGCPPFVAPPGRHVHVAVVKDIDEARELLFPVQRQMVALGTDDVERVRAAWPAARHLRWSRLGQMQHPPLDGPVDLRWERPQDLARRRSAILS